MGEVTLSGTKRDQKTGSSQGETPCRVGRKAIKAGCEVLKSPVVRKIPEGPQPPRGEGTREPNSPEVKKKRKKRLRLEKKKDQVQDTRRGGTMAGASGDRIGKNSHRDQKRSAKKGEEPRKIGNPHFKPKEKKDPERASKREPKESWEDRGKGGKNRVLPT